MNEKKQAVALIADVNRSEVEEQSWDHYGLTLFSAGGCEYAVGTDEQADEAAGEYIKGSLWAFNASWLAEQTGFPEKVFTGLQQAYEDANDAMLALVEKGDSDLDGFISASISEDGRGHFLAPYDFEEREIEVKGTRYYVYRVN